MNVRIWVFIGLTFLALWTPTGWQTWGWTIDLPFIVSWIMGLLFNRFVILGIGRQLDRFVPENPLEAKRLNEQIKSLSTAINATAGAAISVFAFSQIVKDLQHPNWNLLIGALALGFYVHTGARSLLGMLKDETVKSQSA